MFSVICVCQSVCPWGCHVTVAHDALDLIIQGPPGPHPCTGTPPSSLHWDPCPSPGPVPLIVTSASQDERLFQTCSLENPSPVLTSGGYCSMYNGRSSGTHLVLLTMFAPAVSGFYGYVDEGRYFERTRTVCKVLQIRKYFHNKTGSRSTMVFW